MGEGKGTVLVLGSEGVGRGDDTLGFEILMSMLKALPERNDKPHFIVCWNTAVNLLAQGSPVASHFKRLEEQGVSVLAGALCVQELGLQDKMAAGKSATMNEILDVMLNNEVINL